MVTEQSRKELQCVSRREGRFARKWVHQHRCSHVDIGPAAVPLSIADRGRRTHLAARHDQYSSCEICLMLRHEMVVRISLVRCHHISREYTRLHQDIYQINDGCVSKRVCLLVKVYSLLSLITKWSGWTSPAWHLSGAWKGTQIRSAQAQRHAAMPRMARFCLT